MLRAINRTDQGPVYPIPETHHADIRHLREDGIHLQNALLQHLNDTEA